MVVYLLQITFLWCIFSTIYYFVLSNKSMFWFNRWYLLVTFAGSLTIPLIPFNEIFGGAFSVNNVSLPQTILLNELVIDQKASTIFQFDWILVIKILFGIGTAFFLFRFFRELIKIKRLSQQAEKVIYDDLLVCKIPHKQQVFSFGKTIFIDRDLFETINKNDSIWIHEKTHIRQWHSADVLLTEICKVFLWFHPMIYIYERHIKMNHEYLADAAVLKQTNDVKSYQCQLLDYLENTNSSLASTFNFKLTQKRFIMMKSKTNRLSKTTAKMFAIFTAVAMGSFIACNDIDTEDPITNVERKVQADEVFNFVEQKAKPKEGFQSFMENFINTFDTETIVFNDTIVSTRLKFIVEKDGSLSNIEAIGSNNGNVSTEAIRVLKAMPDWIPAQHEGKVVRSTFTLPIKVRTNY